MDNTLKRAKIQQFVNDKVLALAVKETLVDICLKKSKDRDVHNLAGRFIAIELINEAWNSMEKHKTPVDSVIREGGQIAL